MSDQWIVVKTDGGFELRELVTASGNVQGAYVPRTHLAELLAIARTLNEAGLTT